MKKISVIAGMIIAAAMVIVTPATVKAAGMPCTEDTIKQFQATLQAAQQELAVVQQAKAQADANVTALKAQGATGLELLVATDAATNAANVVSAYQHKVNCAQQNLNAIISRGNTEQYYLDYEAAVKARANLDSIKVQLDGQNQVTSAALTQLKNLQAELAKQQANAASNPGLAGNVATVQAQVNAAQATYEAQKAKSDALAASYAQTAAAGGWATDADSAQYNAFVKNYALSNMNTYTWLHDCKDGETREHSFGYWDYNKNGGYGQPNEWAIRWFE